MCAGFPAGRRNGYWFQNRSVGDALLLVIGDRPLGGDASDPLLDGRPGPEWRHRFAANDDGTPA